MPRMPSRDSVKDLVEEQLFARRRTLFSQMVVAFFDTTSIYFEGGGGGDTIGKRGKNKDGHPELKQMVVGLILDGEEHLGLRLLERLQRARISPPSMGRLTPFTLRDTGEAR